MNNSPAFTAKSLQRLPRIVTPLSLRQSAVLCRQFGLQCIRVDIQALWDTSASSSCISRGLAKSLGLKSVELCNVSGVGGIHQSNVYLVDFLLPNQVSIGNIRVTEFIDNGIFTSIIGMDIITLGDFAVTNAQNQTWVSFRMPPAIEHTDYVAEAANRPSP